MKSPAITVDLKIVLVDVKVKTSLGLLYTLRRLSFFPKPDSGLEYVVGSISCVWSYVALQVFPYVGNYSSAGVTVAGIRCVS